MKQYPYKGRDDRFVVASRRCRLCGGALEWINRRIRTPVRVLY